MCELAPPKKYPEFKQRLSLEEGLVTLQSANVIVSVFADWYHDVIRVRVNSTDGSVFSARVYSQNWRNVSRPIAGGEL